MALKQTVSCGRQSVRRSDPGPECSAARLPATPRLPHGCQHRHGLHSPKAWVAVPSTSAGHSFHRAGLQCCRATDQDKQANSWGVLPTRFNPAYAAIVGVYAVLFALQNPYIFAGLSIATIIPQNSTTTSLNSLVILFYDSGLFMNFAEAVYCVRLVTWLSILCCLLSFSVFN